MATDNFQLDQILPIPTDSVNGEDGQEKNESDDDEQQIGRQDSIESSHEKEYKSLLRFSLTYDRELEILIVSHISASNLSPLYDLTETLSGASFLSPSVQGAADCVDPYVKIQLYSRTIKIIAKTSVRYQTSNPVFEDETFQLSVHYDDLVDMTLRLSVCDYDRFSADDVIGEVLVIHMTRENDLSKEKNFEVVLSQGKSNWIKQYIKQHNRTPTDAFGEVEFPGVWPSRRAKYVRASTETSPKFLEHLLTKVWCLRRPELLIEVLGDVKNLEHVTEDLKKKFRESLVKTAVSTRAWIFTRGVSSGIDKEVGLALREHSRRSRKKIVAIGITTWGVLDNKDCLINERENSIHYHASGLQEYCILDPNNTHFLLADDGTNKYGADVILQRCLLKYLIEKYSIPHICMVLGGGLGTVTKVRESLEIEPPTSVVAVKESGRAAALISWACGQFTSARELNTETDIAAKIQELFGITSFPPKIGQDVLAIAAQNEMVTIYRRDDEGDIDEAVFNAVVTTGGQSSQFSEVKLKAALHWNKVNTARRIFQGCERNQNTQQMMENTMFDALKLNRIEFVELLLEMGVSMENTIRSRDKGLEQLYTETRSKHYPTLEVLYRHAGLPWTPKKIEMTDIGDVISCLIGKGMSSPYSVKSEIGRACCFKNRQSKRTSISATERTTVWQDLFLWATLTQKFDLAHLMWQRCQQSIATALIGNQLCWGMKLLAEQTNKNIPEGILEEQHRFYENLALDILQQCADKDPVDAEQLLRAEVKYWSPPRTTVTLAANFKQHKFIGHESVQALLDHLWYGILKDTWSITQLVRLICSSIKAPSCSRRGEHRTPYDEILTEMVTYDGEEVKEKEYDDLDDEDEEPPTFCQTVRQIFIAPITKFIFHTMSYLVFLCMFTYTVLLELSPSVSVVEWIVFSYMVSFLVDEVRQVFTRGGARRSCMMKIKSWATDWWNLIDLVGLLVFFLSFILRLIPGDKWLMAGHLCYCFDIIVWFIRLLQIATVSSEIGPYVKMIYKMGRDALAFGSIALLVMVGYGVVREGIVRPRKTWEWDALRNVFSIPYLQFYGEIFLNEDGTYDCNEENTELCPTGAAATLVPLITSIYLLSANVLLLNMLIAIFSNTFDEARKKSNETWKLQRYYLTLEFTKRPCLPHPFTILEVIYMVFARRFHWPTAVSPLACDRSKVKDLLNFESQCKENYLRDRQGSRIKK